MEVHHHQLEVPQVDLISLQEIVGTVEAAVVLLP